MLDDSLKRLSPPLDELVATCVILLGVYMPVVSPKRDTPQAQILCDLASAIVAITGVSVDELVSRATGAGAAYALSIMLDISPEALLKMTPNALADHISSVAQAHKRADDVPDAFRRYFDEEEQD